MKKLLPHITTTKSKNGQTYHYDKRSKTRISKKEFERRRNIVRSQRTNKKQPRQNNRGNSRSKQKRVSRDGLSKRASRLKNQYKFSKKRFNSKSLAKFRPTDKRRFDVPQGNDYIFRVKWVFNLDDLILDLTDKQDRFVDSIFQRIKQVLDSLRSKKWRGFHWTLTGFLVPTDGESSPLEFDLKSRSQGIPVFKGGDTQTTIDDIQEKLSIILRKVNLYDSYISEKLIVSIRK